MNHDATHCLDYNEKTCPKSCYRAQLTKEFSEIDYELPVSWAKFRATNECPMNSTVTIKIPKKSNSWIGTPCLICGDAVPLENELGAKICDKCKAAVLKVRSEMEKEDKAFFDRIRRCLPASEIK